MTTYYVRTTGNDTTGDGSTGTPWRTLHKAITTIPAAGGHTILIGDGTYSEDSGSGYLLISRTFTAAVTVGSESADAAAVVIKGTSGTTYNVLYQTSGGGIIFEDVTFETRAKEITGGALRISRAAAAVFNRCVFAGLTDAAGNRQALLISPSAGVTVTGAVFNNCTFSLTGYDPAYAVQVNPASGTVDGVAFNGCTGSAVTFGLYVLQGCANVNLTGGVWSNNGSGAGIAYGSDSETATANVTGTISGAVISSPASHACLIGCRAGGVVTLTECVISGGDYAVVVKENAGTVITDNIILNGTIGGLYFKAATGATATGNDIRNSVGGACLKAGAGGTGNLFGSLTVTDNTMQTSGTSAIYNWVGAGDSGELCVVDRNVYDPSGSGLFGVVRGDADVQTLAELRAAWADYGDGTNDANSTSTGYAEARGGMLGNMIYEVGKKAGEVFEGTATGGGAATLIDTNQVSTADDFYNGGTMCILSGTLANTTRVITDYADTSRTFTFVAGPAITAGTRYAAIRPALSRAQIVGAINAALGEMGYVTQHDDTLVVVADTQEYTLPSGVRNVARVQVAQSTTAPYGWKDTFNWRENAGLLIFEPDTEPKTAGMLMRIYYNQPHAEVTLDADVISTDIHPARLAWAAAAHALGQMLRNTRNEGANKDAFTLAQQKAAEMAARYPVRTMPRTPTHSTLGK